MLQYSPFCLAYLLSGPFLSFSQHTAKEVAGKNVASLRTQIQAEAKNKTAYLYTSRISAMMDALISDAVQEKFKQIEQLTFE